MSVKVLLFEVFVMIHYISIVCVLRYITIWYMNLENSGK